MFSARKSISVSSEEAQPVSPQLVQPQVTQNTPDLNVLTGSANSTPPVVPTIPSSSPSVHPPSKPHGSSSKYLFILPVVLVVLLMVGLTAYLQINRAGLVAESTPIPTLPSATISPSPTPIPVIRDKTYQNRNYLIAFSYPGESELSEVVDPNSSSQSMSISLKVPNKEESYFVINIERNSNPESFNNLVLGLSKEELSGREAYYLDATGSEGAQSKLYIFYQNSIYTISWVGQRETVEKIIKSMRFLSPGVTDKWQTLDSTFGQFSLRYPEDWKLVSGGSASASANIRKVETESEYHSLLIQIDKPSAQDRTRSLQLTAGETISSLQNLSGWVSTPVVDYRTIGGGQAQIISGQRQGGWEVYAVMWYRTSLVQFAWRDTLNRVEQENIDSILGSVRFR